MVHQAPPSRSSHGFETFSRVRPVSRCNVEKRCSTVSYQIGSENGFWLLKNLLGLLKVVNAVVCMLPSATFGYRKQYKRELRFNIWHQCGPKGLKCFDRADRRRGFPRSQGRSSRCRRCSEGPAPPFWNLHRPKNDGEGVEVEYGMLLLECRG